MSVLGWLMILGAVVFVVIVASPKPKLPLLFETGMAVSALALFLLGEALVSSGTSIPGKLGFVMVGAALMAASIIKESKRQTTTRPRDLTGAEMAKVQGGKR